MKDLNPIDHTIQTLVRAVTPLVYLYTHEEGRALESLFRVARAEKAQLVTWSITRGLVTWPDGRPVGDGKADFVSVLTQFAELESSALLALLDYHPYLAEPVVVRSLRDLTTSLIARSEERLKSVFLLSPRLAIPVELEKDLVLVDYPLPDRKAIAEMLERVEQHQKSKSIAVSLPSPERDRLVNALAGLTITEAENVLAQAVVITGRLGAEAVPIVLREKEQIVRKSGGGAVEYFHPEVGMESVGGLDLLKTWAKERKEAWGEPARAYGLVPPRGVLLLGSPGGGKSLSVKAIASLWNMPLLRLDIGALFTSALGGTEENLRIFLKVAEAIAPCVVQLDEVEKGLSGLDSSSASDGGTQSRIFATLLTYMEETTKPVFFAATANLTNLGVLPPEFIERFSSVFFVDKPSDAERGQIIQIHLRACGRKPSDFDQPALVGATAGMVGRQIRNAIHQGMYPAFQQSREFNTKDILEALALSENGLRDFDGVKARPASSSYRPARTGTGRAVRIPEQP